MRADYGVWCRLVLVSTVFSALNIHVRLRLPCALRPADERVLGLIRLGREMRRVGGLCLL